MEIGEKEEESLGAGASKKEKLKGTKRIENNGPHSLLHPTIIYQNKQSDCI